MLGWLKKMPNFYTQLSKNINVRLAQKNYRTLIHNYQSIFMLGWLKKSFSKLSYTTITKYLCQVGSKNMPNFYTQLTQNIYVCLAKKSFTKLSYITITHINVLAQKTCQFFIHNYHKIFILAWLKKRFQTFIHNYHPY